VLTGCWRACACVHCNAVRDPRAGHQRSISADVRHWAVHIELHDNGILHEVGSLEV
jgi:hypothetical protein